MKRGDELSCTVQPTETLWRPWINSVIEERNTDSFKWDMQRWTLKASWLDPTHVCSRRASHNRHAAEQRRNVTSHFLDMKTASFPPKREAFFFFFFFFCTASERWMCEQVWTYCTWPFWESRCPTWKTEKKTKNSRSLISAGSRRLQDVSQSRKDVNGIIKHTPISHWVCSHYCLTLEPWWYHRATFRPVQ